MQNFIKWCGGRVPPACDRDSGIPWVSGVRGPMLVFFFSWTEKEKSERNKERVSDVSIPLYVFSSAIPTFFNQLFPNSSFPLWKLLYLMPTLFLQTTEKIMAMTIHSILIIIHYNTFLLLKKYWTFLHWWYCFLDFLDLLFQQTVDNSRIWSSCQLTCQQHYKRMNIASFTTDLSARILLFLNVMQVQF